MGRYSGNNFRPRKPQVDRPHPIWRGIGCVLMVIVPIFSFALAEITVQSSWGNQYIPYQLMGNPVMPTALWKVGLLSPILGFIQNQTSLYAVLIFLCLYILVIGAIVSVANAYLYKSFGPSRLGPQDAPQPKIKVKTYKR
ncbi:MAG: hypothetical protein WBW94_07230 [Anaerolineales bacterium]